MFNPNDFITFSMIPNSSRLNRSATIFPLRYWDRDKDGNISDFIYEGYDGMPRKMKFDKATRYIRVPKSNDRLVEAMRNHPWCKGSRNGNYRNNPNDPENPIQIGVVFKEDNKDKDGSVIVDAAALRIKAGNEVLKLADNEGKLEAVAKVLGVLDPQSVSYTTSRLLMKAEKEPAKVLEVIDSDELLVRSLVIKALESGLLARKGNSVNYSFGGVNFGVDENDIVENLLKDQEKLDVLRSKFQD